MTNSATVWNNNKLLITTYIIMAKIQRDTLDISNIEISSIINSLIYKVTRYIIGQRVQNVNLKVLYTYLNRFVYIWILVTIIEQVIHNDILSLTNVFKSQAAKNVLVKQWRIFCVGVIILMGSEIDLKVSSSPFIDEKFHHHHIPTKRNLQ